MPIMSMAILKFLWLSALETKAHIKLRKPLSAYVWCDYELVFNASLLHYLVSWLCSVLLEWTWRIEDLDCLGEDYSSEEETIFKHVFYQISKFASMI